MKPKAGRRSAGAKVGGGGGTGVPSHPSYIPDVPSHIAYQSAIKKNIFPEPNVEDWEKYEKSIMRNTRNWK